MRNILASGQKPGHNSLRRGPDDEGHFGIYGGRYVAETLMPLILALNEAWMGARRDPVFADEMDYYFEHYIGRPSPLYYAERLSQHLGGAKIYLKRDELNHTGAHKINNCIGQILLAKRMGKTRIIAETGAGQHGVATATVAALFNLPCRIYMGATDIERQKPNVFRMKLLGAEVMPVQSGTKTLKDAMNEALRDWVTNVDSTFYIIGTVAGPHPYPEMVRDFQSVIGEETRQQILAAEGRLPDYLVAAIGGGSNAMGLFHPFLDEAGVAMIGVEAGGHGIASGQHAASLNGGFPGVLHGNRTYLLQDEFGQITDAHSISAGLDYPGIGPEHAWLHDLKRVDYVSATDDEALVAFQLLARLEGIIPALEPSHALAHVMKLAPTLPAKKRAALISFVMAGDPDLEHSEQILRNLPKDGVDLIELGMPFSDPMADGKTIEAAGLRALAAGTTLPKILAMVERFRQHDAVTPIILMGYFNPIYRYGADKFAAEARRVGVDGVIVVDLPPEERGDLWEAAAKSGLDIIRLVAPTTDDARLPQVLAVSTGFVYYISIMGVTGTASASQSTINDNIARLRRHTKMPIAVGFGVKTPEQARNIAKIADGVVVGSSIVERIAAGLDGGGKIAKPSAQYLASISEFVQTLSLAIKNARR
eukprot:Em0263g11a